MFHKWAVGPKDIKFRPKRQRKDKEIKRKYKITNDGVHSWPNINRKFRSVIPILQLVVSKCKCSLHFHQFPKETLMREIDVNK